MRLRSLAVVVAIGVATVTQSRLESAVPHPQASAASKWRVLFDGKSLDAWSGYKGAAIPSGWHIVDGTLAKDAPVADIVSKDEFGDFELEMDWKIGDAGNSGIFYRGTEEYEHIYWSAPEYRRKSTRLNSSHIQKTRMPSSA